MPANGPRAAVAPSVRDLHFEGLSIAKHEELGEGVAEGAAKVLGGGALVVVVEGSETEKMLYRGRARAASEGCASGASRHAREGSASGASQHAGGTQVSRGRSRQRNGSPSSRGNDPVSFGERDKSSCGQ